MTKTFGSSDKVAYDRMDVLQPIIDTQDERKHFRRLIYSCQLQVIIDQALEKCVPQKDWDQMEPWIEQELKICIGREDIDVMLIMEIIKSTLSVTAKKSLGDTTEKQQDRLEGELRCFLFDNTRIFVRELFQFRDSPFTIKAYDEWILDKYCNGLQ